MKKDLRAKPHPDAMDFYKAMEVAGKTVRDTKLPVTIYRYEPYAKRQRNFWLVTAGSVAYKKEWRPVIQLTPIRFASGFVFEPDPRD